MSEELDTIVAPASGSGRNALSIVRVDGPDSLRILGQLASSDSLFEERRATRVSLRNGAIPIDEAVAVYYAGPRSFTGNDLVEITIHGSPYVMRMLLEAVTACGARFAEPGEFTERAVLNGKLDLVQAEAIHDLIAARTSVQARMSLANLDGELSRSTNLVRGVLLDVISRFEAALDFADEGYEFIGRDEAATLCEQALGSLRELEGTFERASAANNGLTAVILGAPNAGKSTLLNFLCGSERAIVTSLPGTTRDLLRETVEIGGLPVTLIDTAGLRSATDEVESIGIERARDAASRADLILYLIDAGIGRTEADEVELAPFPDVMVIYTKSDLGSAPSGERAISVRERSGLDTLLHSLDDTVRARFAPPEGTPFIINERQRRAVLEAIDSLSDALAAVRMGLNEELVVVDLYRAVNALASLTGAVTREDVLRSIFAKFCIGK